ncbi:transmembrane sensor [Pedobacter africanus]|uniref:Ferric-dicitrate binding protein FerR (Iron transport regulator) n=1 Tax=Pedobacter africanus TaxID=151894 RepID=A0ACC6KXR8_9SPHI|nr:FecR domain-containing protein [Pedobacter africanus]MDR6784069.1 ferric-dicitrate binding protein FerR (iron transport regulator) [Pedobacter africanus]
METPNNFKYSSQLIIKFLKDELNAQEKRAFELWLNASPANRELLESFRNTATVQREINYIDAVDTNKGWEEISKQIQVKPVKVSFWNKILKYSAAAILLITTGIGLYYYTSKNNNDEPNGTLASQDIMPGSQKAVLQLADGSALDLGSNKFSLKGENGEVAVSAAKGTLYFGNNKGSRAKGYNLLKTPRAGEYKMVLPDGTKVWLNASSTLRFPAGFNREERRVQLTGEAYFEVAHNKKLPFRVSFNDTEVEVLGTHFNISTFGNQSKTTLIEGSVKVTEAGKQQLLKPGEEATVNEGKVAIHKTDTYKSIAWKEGTFYFQDDLMTDIMDQVLRWYNVEIIYKGKPGTKRYSGNIRRQATLKQVLEMLNAVSGTKFSLEDRTVTVDFNN